MLEYDNSAFYYFALTLLSFYLVPGVWYALKEILLAAGGKRRAGVREPFMGARRTRAARVPRCEPSFLA